MSTPGKEIGGDDFHVGDCHVWSAIYYLDSPTDYRECLPQPGVCPHTIGDDLVMLDSSRNLTSPQTGLSLLSVLVTLVVLIVLFNLLLLHFVDYL
jgi:hypothetical protein